MPGQVVLSAVFLDRDGTLNRAYTDGELTIPPGSVAELEILPGVEDALVQLKQAGFALVVVTNQPDVSRGTQTRAAVEAINEHLARQLPIDEIVCCYHDDADQCACRKPKPGMLVDSAARRGLRLNASYMIGDRWRDIEAGRRAGCTTILVGNAGIEQMVAKADFEANNLGEVARIILGRSRGATP